MANATQSRMWQRIRIPKQYREWISMGVATIEIMAECVSPLALYVVTIFFILS
jgi:hypothetical protein